MNITCSSDPSFVKPQPPKGGLKKNGRGKIQGNEIFQKNGEEGHCEVM